MFHREGKKKKLSLLCFQMTIAAAHRTTADKLQKFFVDELKQRFTYQGRSLKFEIPPAGSKAGLTLICGKEKFALEVHLIYFVSHTNLDGFKYQPLQPTTGSDPKWDRFWSLIQQYKCGPPKSVG